MILNNTDHGNYILSVITENEASLQNADKFKAGITRLIDTGHKCILLSFEHVTYIDSSFLGSMVAVLKYAILHGTEIYLVHLKDDIYELLCLIRMNKVFSIFTSTDEAVSSLK